MRVVCVTLFFFFFFFLFWLAITHKSLLTFKKIYKNIYYLCSYSRKAFAHVIAVSVTFIVTVPPTSNKIISVHKIQVNNVRLKIRAGILGFHA